MLCYRKKPRDVAAVRFGLKFANIQYKLRVAKVRKSDFRALNIPAQNKI